MKKEKCVSCGELVPLRSGEYRRFGMTRESALVEGYEILGTLETNPEDYVLVRGFFCKECSEEIFRDEKST